MPMRLQWDWPAAWSWQGGLSHPAPFHCAALTAWTFYSVLTHLPLPSSFFHPDEVLTGDIFLPLLTFLIFLLMLGAGQSILFVIRDRERCVLCAAENRVLPEREDTNHEDTLLTLLLNKKLAWRRPENIGKWRGWEISAAWTCVCMNARNLLLRFLRNINCSESGSTRYGAYMWLVSDVLHHGAPGPAFPMRCKAAPNHAP